ncbi:MAG: lysophospholipid acyltransferase family protein [Myxococcota bacterium]
MWTLLRTGDRRQALNRATSLWGSLGTRAAGIRLSVEGAEHLDLRPAVFVLNHQSGIDPILVCALLRRDFVGVAKGRIRRNPILGPAFGFAGTVFVDREQGTDPERALWPGVEACQQGLAIAVAPEGRRGDGVSIGRFKKGAFHVALDTGAPIVPIVIRDAGQILPRSGWIMRSGVVHVRVLDPIPTTDWTSNSLNQRVEEIEALYRTTLGDAATWKADVSL